MSFHQILVAIDQSNLCEAVFSQALNLAELNQAKLMLLHCINSEILGESTITMPLDMGLYPPMVNTAYENQNNIMQQRLEESKAMLRRYCETASSRGITTEFDYKIGDPGQYLCQVARNWGADLIVLGRRGHKGLTEVFLGSVSNYVLHNAHCSVLVIQ
ncbi:UspA domain-containing protein [Crinalium epipsammum PCC 9333]|uniref:Universal stress protein n=1 Tax=Crinalium epipsammum PCC 9333 TaxID=1173022 RepID=K9VWG5_9CYAN|nr:universal stress protein [Crinalium epipsammum]AFZ11832.1 UspA domain-containing protein [Crinalium epipsammum PCC 9333]